MKRFFPFVRVLLFLIASGIIEFSFAQKVVVSSYYNDANNINEWTELLVVTDNSDMQNWYFQDNNQTQTAFMTPPYRFKPVAFWQNLRAGTVIMIWSHTNGHPTQVFKKDGYIEVTADDPTYFSGGAGPGGSVLNIATPGDLVRLSDASGTFVHNIGHMPVYGNSFALSPSPKLNYNNTLANGAAVCVSPGQDLDHYGTLPASTPQDGNQWLAVETGAGLTFGLPNKQNPNNLTYPASVNSDFWRSLRQPTWSAPTLSFTVDVPNTQVTLTWNAATDPNPADGTQGYMIVRNTVNTFGIPVDGHTYLVGDAITGGGTVIKEITSSQTLTYADNTPLPCADGFYYQIFAFRYTQDNVKPNDYDVARGRAYNETSFASVHAVYPAAVDPTTATATPNTYCATSAPASILLEAPGGSGTTLNWYLGGCGTSAGGTLVGPGSGATNSYTIATPPTTPGTYTYYARWETVCGQSNCKSVTITVNSQVTPTFSPIGPVCQNSVPPALPATSNNTPPVAGTWSPPTINTTLVGTTTYTFTPAASECATTATLQVNVTAPVAPTFTQIGPLCLNSTPPPLPATSNNTPPISGTWAPPVINTSAVGTSAYTFTPNASECATSYTMNINITSQITPTFNQIGPLCVNSAPPVLPGSSTNVPPITGSWNPPTINTTTAGTTTYSFTPNSGQCAAATTMDITVAAQITPTFNQIGPLCINSTPPTLPGNSTNTPPITGSWSPSTISTSTIGNTTYTFTPGAGQCGTTTTMVISVTSQIQPLFAQIGPLCMNSSPPALPPSSTNIPPITGSWNPLTISTTTSGNFQYKFTPDAGQCAKDTTLLITINLQISPTFDPIGPLCLNSTPPALPPASTNDIPGSWIPSTITTSSPGTTTYTFTPDSGQCGAPVGVDITVLSEITPTFDPIGPLCLNSTPPALPATSSNGVAGTWNPPTISTGSTGANTYDFTPTPVGSGLCALPASISIDVAPNATATISLSATPASACQGTQVKFTADTTNGGANPQFKWMVDGTQVQQGSSGTFTTTSLNNGQSVTCQMTSSLSCVATNPVTSTAVSVPINPNPHVTLSTQPYLCSGVDNQLDAGPNYTAYLWQDGSTDRYFTASAKGLYWVQITDSHGCTGGSDTVQLKTCETGVYVPTAFSPNNDGTNDIFKPVATLDENTSYTFSVIDRWGETVFETHSFNVGWDGSFGGQLLPPGIYGWVIVYQSINSTEKPVTLKGTVTLIR